MISNKNKTELEKQWREKFPSTLSGLFSFYQCLCTIVIIGCELGSILIDIFHATIYVGFWASLFFMIAWISQTAAVTCRRTHKCATYTLIIQCITLIFAACVISFDAYFIITPTACFFSLTLCNSTAPVRGVFYSQNNFNNIKIPLIKGQLATAVIMFAFCIDYIIIYVVTHFQIKNGKQPKLKNSREVVSSPINGAKNTTLTRPSDIHVLNINENTINVSPSPQIDRTNTNSTDIVFDSSFGKCSHHSRWSFDDFDDSSPVKI